MISKLTIKIYTSISFNDNHTISNLSNYVKLREIEILPFLSGTASDGKVNSLLWNCFSYDLPNKTWYWFWRKSCIGSLWILKATKLNQGQSNYQVSLMHRYK